MNSSPTTENFVGCLRKSALIKSEVLEAFLARLNQGEDMPEEPLELAKRLMNEGLLTKFQAEQLLQGRYKNFGLAGKYRVLERLSSGPMSTVFLCEHITMRRLVALKLLPVDKAKDPTTLARFHREARAAARLRHPNVVAVYDLDSAADLHFLVAEFVDGNDLEHVIAASGPMTIDRAADCIRQAAEGLQHAHEMGMVHRDIKPGNLILDRSGTVKLLDLGLARLFLDESDGLTHLDNGRLLLGTIDYLAPEQAQDSHEVDIRADIYSLGATAYFLVSGRTLFQGASTAQKLAMHGHRPVDAIVRELSGIPRGFCEILLKMLEKDPANRYQTPAEVAEAMSPWSGQNIPPPSVAEMPRLCIATRRAVDQQSRSVAVRVPARSSSSVETVVLPATPLVRWHQPHVKGKRLGRNQKIGLGAAGVVALAMILWRPWGGPIDGAPIPPTTKLPAAASSPPPPAPTHRESVADLLTSGKFQPIDIQPVATVVTTRGMFFDPLGPRGEMERLIFPDWGPKAFQGVPFKLVDPQGDLFRNAIMLHSHLGVTPPKMPKSVSLPINAPTKAIHFLSGVSGWGAKASTDEKSISMIVRLHYADGQVEDHALKNNIHFADYFERWEVPESKLAFRLRGQQLRYLAVIPERKETIDELELLKGPDHTAPIIMAVTIETDERNANE